MKRFWALAATVWLVLAPPASADDCAETARVAAPLDGPLHEFERVEDYAIVLQSCHRPGAADVLAIRTMRVDAERLFLAVDPGRLTTRLERAACWTCDAVGGAGSGRFPAAVAEFSTKPGRSLASGAQDNAGLTRGRGKGAFLTADLCPSHLPLDREFLRSLEREGGATPIALSISGLWLKRHREDFAWLRREKAEGRLDITFVNHSYTHPYLRSRPDGVNFLLMPGYDRRSEVLDLERLLIANGETPSVFFRFPGLISDAAFLRELLEFHLIPLGAESWLANGQAPHPGGVLLVHANGNEPFGLKVFDRLRRAKALPQPFRPINEAP